MKTLKTKDKKKQGKNMNPIAIAQLRMKININ